MGAWGTAIFSDDLALDIKQGFRDFIGDGFSPEETTNRLVKEYASEVNDPNSGTIFWLSLALAQWNAGRLLDDVKQKAISIINTGKDLENWKHDPQSLKKRKLVLKKLKEKLQSDQPELKKIPKRFRDSTDWEVGDVVSYELLSGKLILFRIIGFHQDKGGRGPVAELLDWVGTETPEKKQINKLKIKTDKNKPWKPTQYLIGSISKRDYPTKRIQLVTKNSPVSQKVGRFAVWLWKFVDKPLEENFDLK